MDNGHLFCYDRPKMPKTMKGSPVLGGHHVFRIDLLACASITTLFDGRIVGGEGSDCEFD